MELIDKLITGGTILYMYYTVDKCSHFPQNGGAVAALEGPTSESQKCCSYGPTDMVESHNCGFTLLEIEQRPWTSSFFSWKLIFQTPYLILFGRVYAGWRGWWSFQQSEVRIQPTDMEVISSPWFTCK